MARSQSPRPGASRRAVTQPVEGTLTARDTTPAPDSWWLSQLRWLAEAAARLVEASDTTGGCAACAGPASAPAASAAASAPLLGPPATKPVTLPGSVTCALAAPAGR